VPESIVTVPPLVPVELLLLLLLPPLAALPELELEELQAASAATAATVPQINEARSGLRYLFIGSSSQLGASAYPYLTLTWPPAQHLPNLP
jgi:hypothetical protein